MTGVSSATTVQPSSSKNIQNKTANRAFEHPNENGRNQLVQVSTPMQDPDESTWNRFTNLFTDSGTDFKNWLEEFQNTVDDTYQSYQDS